MATTAPAPRVLGDVFRLENTRVRDLLLVVGGALLVGLTAQVAVPLPWTPVPLTGQTFGVLLVGASLGAVRGILALLLYSVAGLVGMPWFAQGSSGFSASFGYILGFIAAAGLVGWLAERGWTRNPLDTALAMILGNVVIYLIGVVWLKFALTLAWSTAIYQGMSVFMVGDAIKIALAAGLFPLVWRQLAKRGLAPRAGVASEDTSVATMNAADEDQVIDLTDGTPAREGETDSIDARE